MAMALGKITTGPNGGVVKWYITYAPSKHLTSVNHLEGQVNTVLTSVNGAPKILLILQHSLAARVIAPELAVTLWARVRWARQEGGYRDTKKPGARPGDLVDCERGIRS
ncbi:MAG: hypothetical protein EpisKO_23800 [Epibacterium sp.]